MALETMVLKEWSFWPEGREAEKYQVTVPHTWNVDEGLEEYWGIGWYRYELQAEENWRDQRVWLRFGAIYHDAEIFLNGEKIGSHCDSGYTPFTVELTSKLIPGSVNPIEVRVDNSFSENMLPYKRSFDWANDGGLIRPVQLLVTGSVSMGDILIKARPVLTVQEKRQDGGCGVFAAEAELLGQADTQSGALSLSWELYEGCDGNLRSVCEGKELCSRDSAQIEGRLLENIDYWHFDRPSLYTLKLILKQDGQVLDIRSQVFGFRSFQVVGNRFYLNGEPVRLCGTEWMPGSNPEFGMAEPVEELERMLLCLKETNCVFTRFHWQQDDAVYDWCDRHGMLVQEEVPFWGIDPPKAGSRQLEVSCQQLREMVAAHRNHPSIVFWGVGNELDGHARETMQYIRDAVAYAHELDPDRGANYVSNSVFRGSFADGTRDGDVIMVNDYIGTWHGELDQYGEWARICTENPGRAKVPSEFGLCEPAFSGGDEARIRIFLEKIRCYRQFEDIAGTVNFCLNDYRTQMGEDGAGKMRRRIHGSTDLWGVPKPSWQKVREESSPLVVEAAENRIACRADLPCYTVKGYVLEAENPHGTVSFEIPELKPGDTYTVSDRILQDAEEIRIYRPDGDRVL